MNRLALRLILAQHSLERLRNATMVAEDGIVEDIRAFNDRADHLRSTLHGEELHEALDILGDEHLETWENVPNVIRCGLFLSAYAFLEDHMNQVCEVYRTTRKLKVPPVYAIKTGGGIQRARAYLNRHAPLKGKKSWHAWKLMLGYNDVRNCLIHHNGVISAHKNAAQLQAFIDAPTNLVVQTQTGRILVPDGAVPEFLDHIQTFLNELHGFLPVP